MKTLMLPNTNLEVSNIILGLMRIAPLADDDIRSLVGASRDAGINFFDHADVYGGQPHECERRFGDAVTFSAEERATITIQSKVGLRSGFWDFSKEHILRSVDESLDALKTNYLDILLLHRPDALVEPDEVAEAFDILHSAGKVLNFGVSNHTPGQVELLKRSVSQPLIVNQIQLSITHAPLIAAGVSANMAGLDQSIDRDNGILDYCRLNGITLRSCRTTISTRRWLSSTRANGRWVCTRTARTQMLPGASSARPRRAAHASTCAQLRDPCRHWASAASGKVGTVGTMVTMAFASSPTPAVSLCVARAT